MGEKRRSDDNNHNNSIEKFLKDIAVGVVQEEFLKIPDETFQSYVELAKPYSVPEFFSSLTGSIMSSVKKKHPDYTTEDIWRETSKVTFEEYFSSELNASYALIFSNMCGDVNAFSRIEDLYKENMAKFEKSKNDFSKNIEPFKNLNLRPGFPIWHFLLKSGNPNFMDLGQRLEKLYEDLLAVEDDLRIISSGKKPLERKAKLSSGRLNMIENRYIGKQNPEGFDNLTLSNAITIRINLQKYFNNPRNQSRLLMLNNMIYTD